MKKNNLPSIQSAFRKLADRLAWQLSLLLFLALMGTGVLVSLQSNIRQMETGIQAVWKSLERLVSVGDKFFVQAELASLLHSGAIDKYELSYTLPAETQTDFVLRSNPEKENTSRIGQMLAEAVFPLERSKLSTLATGGELQLQAIKYLDLTPLVWTLGITFFVWLLIFWLGRYHLRRMASKITAPILGLEHSVSTASSHKDLTLEKLPERFQFRELMKVGQAFHSLSEKIDAYEARQITMERNCLLGQVASQVAHDIRSPLTALKVIGSRKKVLKEKEWDLFQSAVLRIQGIANDLLCYRKRMALSPKGNVSTAQKIKTSNFPSTPILIPVEAVLSEKKLQLSLDENIHLSSTVETSAYFACIQVDKQEFERVLSNLIDNAREAVASGSIKLTIGTLMKGDSANLPQSLKLIKQFGVENRLVDRIRISIRDNGKGIPAEIFEKLGEADVSYGKHGGTGLGLYTVRSKIEQWGGTLSVWSLHHKGTEAVIELPLSAPPSWLATSLTLPKKGTLVLIEDDVEFATELKSELGQNYSGPILHFSNTKTAATWLSNDESRQAKFLCDYHLNCEQTGLDFIETNQLHDRAILVTKSLDDETLFTRCESLGVKIFPKPILSYMFSYLGDDNRKISASF